MHYFSQTFILMIACICSCLVSPAYGAAKNGSTNMKILMVVQEFPIQSETFVVNQVIGLLDRGHDVRIYSYRKQAPPVLNKDIDDYRLMDRAYFEKLPPDIGSFDVIIAQFGTCGIEALNAIKKKHEGIKAKLITFFRGFDISSWAIANPGAYDQLFKEGDLFIVECEFFKNRLIAMGADPERILVHYSANSVQLGRFAYAYHKEEIAGAVRLITVSRLVEKKGLEDALRAMKIVNERYPLVEYVIIGGGELREKLEKLAHELEIAHRVHFLGSMSPIAVAGHLGNAHIFILPCVVAQDGNIDAVPTSLKEAMASGLPVVSTLVSGIPELVEDGKSGFLVEQHDPQALAEKISYLIEHPDVRESYGRMGRQIVEEKCDFTILNNELESILLQLIAEKESNSILSVDFEESMGKNDPYMHRCYGKFTEALNDTNHHFFRYVRPYSAPELITLCRNLYKKNNLLMSDQSAPRIPRVIHQIWVGKKPFPEKYKKWQETWRSIPGWTYKLWTDEDVERMDFPNKEIYMQEKNMGARADILRAEILYQFGGAYADTDFELLHPESLTQLHNSFDFYSALNPLDRESLVIANGLMGSVPGHPILASYRTSLQAAPQGKDSFTDIINNRGPGLLTKMVLLHADKGYRDIILPASYCYPLGVEQMLVEPYASMADTREKLERLKQDTYKPESIAIHWWEGSWKLPDSWEDK